MAEPKVNEGAVQAEFQAICLLVQSITSKTGPQMWQGGSAGRFAAAIDGNNGTLATMMDGVWRAMQSVNKDNPPAPPSLPRAQPQPTSPGVASLNPDLADAMAGSLSSVANELPGHGRQLAKLLAEGKTVASTQACTSVANWCRSQVGLMRLRAEYARASDQVGQGVKSSPGQAAIPDVDKFGPAQMSQLGRLQGQVFNQQFDHPGNGSPEEIARIGADLRENLKDPDYLRSFFGAGGVKHGYIGKLPYWLHRNNQDGHGRKCVPANKVIGDFGTALAALSRKRGSDSQAAAWNALGKAGSDMPGQGLLVKYSDGKWGSDVLAELGKASLRWRLRFPYYSIDKSYEETTVDLIDPERWWPADWGVHDVKHAKALDPALNVLNQINAQHDEAAARKLAGTLLPADLAITDPGKVPKSTWLSRLNGDSYASLLTAADWLDRGKAAGGVLGLATAQHGGMGREDAEQAAAIAGRVMQAVAWWNKAGRGLASGFIGDNAKMSDEFSKSDQYNIELGSGLKDGLQQVARIGMPALGNANRSRSDVFIPTIDPASGLSYYSIGGDTAREFLRTFATDKKRWAQIVADSSLYRQRLFAQAIREGEYEHLPRRAGLLDGTLIAAKLEELENRTQISKDELAQEKQELAYLRDAIGVFFPKIPIPSKPIASDGKNGKKLGDVPGFTDVYSKGTDWMLSKVSIADLEKSLQRARAENAHYTDDLEVDLARAIGATYPGPFGERYGVSLDSAIRKGNLSPTEKAVLMDWAEKYWFVPGKDSKYVQPSKGAGLIDAADDGVKYNITP
jgi:hypothetical protein